MNRKTKYIVVIGMLTALSTVLYYMLEVPVGAIVGMPHLKFDFSDIPALIGAVVLGPMAGVIIELLKCLLHLPKTTTFGIGDAINFFIGVAMILPFLGVSGMLIRRGVKKYQSYMVGYVVGTVCTVIVGMASNYLLFPVYFSLAGFPVDNVAIMAAVQGSVLLNLIKTLLTVGPVVPFIERLEKAYEKTASDLPGGRLSAVKN
ncbi:MAG: ECF transporter S component [Eubacteriales bacterium]|jgi:riboflavin transporter FmnP